MVGRDGDCAVVEDEGAVAEADVEDDDDSEVEEILVVGRVEPEG